MPFLGRTQEVAGSSPASSTLRRVARAAPERIGRRRGSALRCRAQTRARHSGTEQLSLVERGAVSNVRPLPTELEGESIRLRRLSVDDATNVHAAAMESAAELERTVPWFSRGMTLDSFRSFAEWAEEAWDRGEHYELSILAKDGA